MKGAYARIGLFRWLKVLSMASLSPFLPELSVSWKREKYIFVVGTEEFDEVGL